MSLPAFTHQITFLTTQDLEATHAFYTAVMGFPLVLDQGDCRIYRTTGNAYLGFCLRAGQPVETGSLILTLVTQQVDAWHARLVDYQVFIDKPPLENPRYGIYQFFARDPNGYRIEIQSFHHPFDPEKE